ncbi:MAG: hypothetical protein ABSG43_06830 [Solirubrobacteraceae bacterium]|jgi:hypothetical protein
MRNVTASLASLALMIAGGLAGCGDGGPRAALDVARLPFVAGAQVTAQARQCDRGANAFCALQFVAVDPRYHSSGDFIVAERRYLRSLGWSLVNGEANGERAAESPGHKLRLTYSSATSDLQQVELGLIQRARPIEVALSQALFRGAPAMSLMLEDSSS